MPANPQGTSARYAISWGAGYPRKHRVVRMPRWLALFVGQHLWRVLGKYHSVQIEEGVFPSSPIPTADQPVKREADHLRMDMVLVKGDPIAYLRWLRQGAGHYTSIHDVPDIPPPEGVEFKLVKNEALSTPLRTCERTGALLLEGTRTNYALWSQP